MSMPNGFDPDALSHGTELRLDTVIEGLKKAIPQGISSVTVAKTVFAIADLEKKVQGLVKPWKDLRAAHALIDTILAAREASEVESVEFLGHLRIALVALLGRDNPALTDFGFKPYARPSRLTPEQYLKRAEKARLTRELRGTKGKKQKEALRATGTPPITIAATGTGATITPMPTPASPVAPPTSNPTTTRTAI